MDKGKLTLTEYPVKNWKQYNQENYGSYKQLKLLLLKEIGVCFWCKITVKDYPYEDGVPDKPDMATVDHIQSRFERKKGEVVEKVLACYKCNQRRAKEDERKYKSKPSKKDVEHLKGTLWYEENIGEY